MPIPQERSKLRECSRSDALTAAKNVSFMLLCTFLNHAVFSLFEVASHTKRLHCKQELPSCQLSWTYRN